MNLRIGIQQRPTARASPARRRCGGERGLAHAAFLVEQRDDHGLALRVGKPVVAARASRRVVVVHRGAALLLPVREFKLGKLRRPKPTPALALRPICCLIARGIRCLIARYLCCLIARVRPQALRSYPRAVDGTGRNVSSGEEMPDVLDAQLAIARQGLPHHQRPQVGGEVVVPRHAARLAVQVLEVELPAARFGARRACAPAGTAIARSRP